MSCNEYPLDQSRRQFWTATVGKAFVLAGMASFLLLAVFSAFDRPGNAQGGIALFFFVPAGVVFFLVAWLWLVLLFYVLDFRQRQRAHGSDTDHEREDVGAAAACLILLALAFAGAGVYFLRW